MTPRVRSPSTTRDAPVRGAEHRVEGVAKRPAAVDRGLGRRAVRRRQRDLAERDEREPAHERALAEEPGHERGLRMREQLLGRRELLEHAALREQRDAVAELHRLVDVVGHEDDRLADHALEPEQLVLEAVAGDRVDGAEGLVHEQDVRIGAERPGDAHALALAAAELRRAAGARSPSPAGAMRSSSSSTRAWVRCLRPAEQPRHGRDVLGDRLVREEAHLLDDVADRAPQVVDVVRPGVAVVDADRARGRLDEPVDHLQRGGLAAPRGADEDHDLARLDLEREMVDGDLARRSVLSTLSNVITSPPPRPARVRGRAGCRRG